MQNIANKYVRVSEVASYYLCPRLVYFQRRHEAALTDAEVRAGFFKSLSYELAVVISSPQPGLAIVRAIDLASSDAMLIYGPSFEQAVTNAAREARDRADAIVSGILNEKERSGEAELIRLLSPPSKSMMIFSDSIRMSGSIDKVVYEADTPIPVIISASLPPETGVYASDRVKIAAYAMLISEKYRADCTGGVVEYVPGWSARRIRVRFEDKRKALYARNRVLEMNEGRMPDGVKGKYCGRCEHYEACNVKVSLLDSIFKKRDV